jgi:hypothetical protein
MIAYSTAAVAIAKSAPHGRRRSSLSLYFDDIDAPLCRPNYDSSHIGQSVFCHPAAALEQAWSPPKVPRAVGIYTCKIAEAEAQGLPYVLAPRVLSRQEWIEQYSVAPASPPCSSGSRATVCRICNGLGIMRACLETQKLEQLEARTFHTAMWSRRPHN